MIALHCESPQQCTQRQKQKNKLYYFYAPRKPDLVLRLVLLYPSLPGSFIYLPVVVHFRHKLFLTKYSLLYMHMRIDFDEEFTYYG